jgi:hypothetical protein
MGEVMDSKRTLSAATSPTRERRTAEACIVMCVGVEEERTNMDAEGYQVGHLLCGFRSR